MKKLLIALLMVSNCSIAQALEWANSNGAEGSDFASSVAIDASNNTFVIGSYQGTVDFDPGSGIVNLQSNGESDIFIQKLDPEGNLVWARSLGGVSRESGKEILADSEGNIIILGSFKDTIDADPGSGVTMLTSTGESDILVLKLNSDGDFLWVKKIGTTKDDLGYALVHDSMDNSYITGRYEEYLGPPVPGNTSGNSTFISKIFVTKITSSGTTEWFQTVGGPGFDYGSDIDLDGDDFVYVNGRFQETLDFDAGSGVEERTSTGGSDSYLLKLDTDGNFIWVKTFGGTLRDYARSIAVDSFGNILTLGLFEDTIDLDPGSGIFNLTSNGFDDFYIQKLDSDGNFIWGKSVGGPSDDIVYDLELDTENNLYATGSFFETTDFNPNAGTFEMTSMGVNDIFLLSLSSTGNFIDAESIGGAGFDVGYKVLIDELNHIILAGSFYETVDFNPGNGTFNLSSNGLSDAFVIKLNKRILASGETPTESIFIAYPNPTNGQLTVALRQIEDQISVNLYNMLGQQIRSYHFEQTKEFDLEIAEASGVYFIEVITNSSNKTIRIIKN